MCGIAGFCSFNKLLNSSDLKNMTDVLVTRGPDDSGYEFIENQEYSLGLGQRRLSILDLSSQGHQPYKYKNLTIVYNGEVYNFKEIRSELIKFDYTFISNSDTEVIIKAFHKWGVKCVDKFIGMFAFTIFDKTSNKIYIFRDRTGVKPLYYYKDDTTLLFASELKSFMKLNSFKKEIDKTALILYFQYGYIPSPYAIFKNTYKLKAGHYIEFDLLTKEFNEVQYWDVLDFYNKPKLNISLEEASQKLEEILKSSFNYRMVSDVPVGVFLSGGYDSSAVVSILQKNSKNKIKTFTIGFDEEKYNEAKYAKEISNYLGTEHHEYYCIQQDALDIIPKLVEIFDEPFGDTSAIPTILVSEFAKQKVSVSLSGDGGDELFAGYDIYHDSIYQNNKFQKFNILSPLISNINPKYLSKINNIYNLTGKYYKFIELISAKTQLDKFNIYSKYYYNTELKKLLNIDVNKINIFNTILNKQDDEKQELLANSYKTYLSDDILVKIDKATMSVSLEGREPLLDHRIIEFVAQLPYEYKYKDGSSKVILKNIVHKYIPKDLMDRKKQGFSIPLDEWLRNDLKVIVLDTLKRTKKNRELFNDKYIDDLIEEFYKYNGNPYKLWLLFIFQSWYERWIDEK